MKKFLLVAVSAAALASCGSHNNPSNPGNVGAATNCRPIDYEAGVWFFPCGGAHYGNAVSLFRKKHPDDRIVAEDWERTPAGPNGHWVFTEPTH